MEKTLLTPLKIEYFPDDTFFGTHYKINDQYCCKSIGARIVEKFPDALTSGINPLDVWIYLSDQNGSYHEEATSILVTMPPLEQDFIRNFLMDYEDGKYEIDEDYDDDDYDNYDDDDDCDDDCDCEDEDDSWDGDPELGPKVE